MHQDQTQPDQCLELHINMVCFQMPRCRSNASVLKFSGTFQHLRLMYWSQFMYLVSG